MPSLKSLVPEQRTLSIKFDQGSLSVVYRPREITFEPEAIQERRDSDEARNQNAEDIARAVISWDFTGPFPDDGSLVKEGEMFPLDARLLARLPFEFLSTVALALVTDGQPDPQKMQRRLQRLGSTMNGSASPDQSLSTLDATYHVKN